MKDLRLYSENNKQMADKKIENKIYFGKGCVDLWERIVNPQEEINVPLKSFLEFCLYSMSMHFYAYDRSKSSLERQVIQEKIMRHMNQLMEYVDTGNIKGYQEIKGFRNG